MMMMTTTKCTYKLEKRMCSCYIIISWFKLQSQWIISNCLIIMIALSFGMHTLIFAFFFFFRSFQPLNRFWCIFFYLFEIWCVFIRYFEKKKKKNEKINIGKKGAYRFLPRLCTPKLPFVQCMCVYIYLVCTSFLERKTHVHKYDLLFIFYPI